MGRAGYSLFEVLIAFVVLSLVLAAIIPGQSQLLMRTVMQEQHSLAHDYALSRIARLGVSDAIEDGVFEERYRNWSITIDVQASDEILEMAQTRQITVTVRDLQDRELARVQTLRVLP